MSLILGILLCASNKHTHSNQIYVHKIMPSVCLWVFHGRRRVASCTQNARKRNVLQATVAIVIITAAAYPAPLSSSECA